MDTEQLIQKPGCLDAYAQILESFVGNMLIFSNAQSSSKCSDSLIRCFDTKMLKCFHIEPFVELFESGHLTAGRVERTIAASANH